jgi:DNA-binding transcriptional regulator YiaG
MRTEELSEILDRPNLTPTLCREARTLLDWEPGELAFAARVSLAELQAFESGGDAPPAMKLSALRAALERGGISFTPGDGRRGVRLRTGRQ